MWSKLRTGESGWPEEMSLDVLNVRKVLLRTLDCRYGLRSASYKVNGVRLWDGLQHLPRRVRRWRVSGLAAV